MKSKQKHESPNIFLNDISYLRIICFLISRLFAATAKLTKNIGQGKSVKMASIVVAKLKVLKNSWKLKTCLKVCAKPWLTWRFPGKTVELVSKWWNVLAAWKPKHVPNLTKNFAKKDNAECPTQNVLLRKVRNIENSIQVWVL